MMEMASVTVTKTNWGLIKMDEEVGHGFPRENKSLQMACTSYLINAIINCLLSLYKVISFILCLNLLNVYIHAEALNVYTHYGYMHV